MEIKIGKYTLRSDRFCAWIDKDYLNKENGKIYQRRVAGYCRDFGTLLDDFIDNGVKESDATEVKQLLAEIESVTKDAKKIARAAYKGDFAIVRNAPKEKKEK